jgi:hypothetical protein
MSSVRNPRDGVNVKCVRMSCELWRRVVDLPVRQSQRCAAAPARPLPRQRAAALWAGMTKNSRAIFYLRTPAPSDDHAVLWYLPTCPEMRGLRTPPQTLLTLPRRSFFSPISPIPLTPPARPRSRASLAQSFFTCVWTTATLNKAWEIGGVHGIAIPVLQWWRRDSSRVASHEAGRPRRLEHSCRGCQDGLVTYGVGWLQRHLAAGRRHQHSCVSRSGDLPTTSASTHTRSHPQSRRISPAYLRHAFRTRGELPTAPI